MAQVKSNNNVVQDNIFPNNLNESEITFAAIHIISRSAIKNESIISHNFAQVRVIRVSGFFVILGVGIYHFHVSGTYSWINFKNHRWRNCTSSVSHTTMRAIAVVPFTLLDIDWNMIGSIASHDCQTSTHSIRSQKSPRRFESKTTKKTLTMNIFTKRVSVSPNISSKNSYIDSMQLCMSIANELFGKKRTIPAKNKIRSNSIRIHI